MSSPRTLARITGQVCLVIIGCVGVGEGLVRASPVVPGDAVARAQNMLASEGRFRLGFVRTAGVTEVTLRLWLLIKGLRPRPAAAGVALVLAALLPLGCGGDAPAPRDAPTVVDSAGVRIVEHGPAAFVPAPLAATEVVRVGSVEGDPNTMFSTVAGGRFLEDGSFVVADRPTNEVRRFAPDGTFVAKHGGEGQGPGEYEYIRGLSRCAPTGFHVFDISWRMSEYDADGAFVRETPPPLETGRSPYHLACARDGRTASISWGDLEGPRIGFHTSMAEVRLTTPDGSPAASLGMRIGSERFGQPSGSGPHPAGRATRFAFEGDDLVLADGTFFGFERWRPDGTLEEIVRIDVPAPNLDSLMSRYVEVTLARAGSDEQRRAWRGELEDVASDGPDQATYLSNVVVTDAGILVQEPEVGDGARWFLFRTDGTPAGFLPLGRGAQLLDLRDGRALVVERDDLDVPSLVVYRLEPTG